MKFQFNTHIAHKGVQDTMLDIEDLCRRHPQISVEYQGKEDGTVIEASEEALQELLDGVKEDRDELFDEMVDASSNSRVAELEEERKHLKHVRNKFRRLIEDADHKWRID